MICADCTAARTKTWGGYAPGCVGCIARSAARSLDAWNALHPKGNGDREGLREQIARRLANVPLADARRAVFEWWQHDKGVTA